MTNQKPIHIDLKQGVGSSGSQTVSIDCSVKNTYPRVYNHLIETHVGSITFDPRGLREVVEVIADAVDTEGALIHDFSKLSLGEKNRLNNLSQSFYDDLIAQDFEPYFHELEDFLTSKGNEDLHQKLGKITRALNRNIRTSSVDGLKFETILSGIENSLLDSQYDALSNKQDSITLLLYYLYANCYIGIKTEGER